MRALRFVLGIVATSLCGAQVAKAQLYPGPYPEQSQFSAVDLNQLCGVEGSYPSGINSRGDVVLNGNKPGIPEAEGVYRYIASTGVCTQLKSTREMERVLGHDRNVGSVQAITDDGTVFVMTQTNFRKVISPEGSRYNSTDSDEIVGIVPSNADRVVLVPRVGQFDEYSLTAVSPVGRSAGVGIADRSTSPRYFNWFREIDGRYTAVPQVGGRPFKVQALSDSGYLVGYQLTAGFRTQHAVITPTGQVIWTRGLSVGNAVPGLKFTGLFDQTQGRIINNRGQFLALGSVDEDSLPGGAEQPHAVKFDLASSARRVQVFAGQTFGLNECGSVLMMSPRENPYANHIPRIYSDAGVAFDLDQVLLSQGSEPTARVAVENPYLMNDSHQVIVSGSEVDSLGRPIFAKQSLYLITPRAGSAVSQIGCASSRVITKRADARMAAALKKAGKTLRRSASRRR